MAKNPVVRALQAVIRAFQPPSEKFQELLQQSAANVKHGTVLLHDLVSDYTSIPDKVAAVKAAEQEGDRITQEIMHRLDRQFVTPMDREDISHLAQCLDDVLDLCEAAATRLNRFQFPPPPAAVELAAILVRCATETEHCVQGLEHISGDHSHHWRSIHSLENQADEIERAAVFAELNRAYECIEAGTWQDYARAAVLSTHWTEICERIERATDRCEDAANVMETLSAKYG